VNLTSAAPTRSRDTATFYGGVDASGTMGKSFLRTFTIILSNFSRGSIMTASFGSYVA
jgi:hypothetical protein